MNFWEARVAAFVGKKVKIVGEEYIYTILNFSDEYGKVHWNNYSISAAWEIVEEPKTVTSYLNVYPHSHGEFTFKSLTEANNFKSSTIKSQIEIITDENGRLVSAKNVD